MFVTVLEELRYINKVSDGKYQLLPAFWEQVNEVQLSDKKKNQLKEEIKTIDYANYCYYNDEWDVCDEKVKCLVLYDLSGRCDSLGKHDQKDYGNTDMDDDEYGFNVELSGELAYEMIVIPPSIQKIHPYAVGMNKEVEEEMDQFLGAYFWKYQPIPGFKIMGEPGSAAEEYAAREGFSFVPITPYFKTYYPR